MQDFFRIYGLNIIQTEYYMIIKSVKTDHMRNMVSSTYAYQHMVIMNGHMIKHIAKGNILDLIFMEEATSIKLTSCQVGPFLSDHKPVSAVLNIKKPPIEKKTLSVCKLKCITDESFKAAFNKNAIDLTSPVNTVLHQLNDEMHKALDTIAPLKEIQVALCQRQPWFDKVVKARHNMVLNRERTWHKYSKPDTWKAYQVKKNIYNRLLIYKKKQLISKQVSD